MVPEPVGEACLIQIPAREGEDEGNDVFLGSIDSEGVQAEEEIHRLEGDTLVAIHKRMVAGDAESIGGCERGKIGFGLVEKPVARAFEGRL